MDLDEIIAEAMNDIDIVGYQYFTRLKERTIVFNDECAKDIVEKVAMPLLQFEKDSNTSPVHLYINTEGGDVFASLFICNIIDKYTKPLYIHILGYCCSMGCLLACAGKNNPNVHKDCYSFTIFMLHSGSLSISSDSAKAKSFINFNTRLEEKEKNYILSHTSIDKNMYEKFMDSDFWMTAEEALQYNIVDKIIDEEE